MAKLSVPGLNKALKAFRVFNRMTQKVIAKKLDLPVSFVSEMETGKKSVSISLIEKYAEFFNVPSWEIVYLGDAYDHKQIRKGISGKLFDLIEWITTDDTNEAVRLTLKSSVKQESYTDREFSVNNTNRRAGDKGNKKHSADLADI